MSEMFDRLETDVSEACDWALPPHLLKKAIRAALVAMREPTDDMKNCSDEIHWGYSCHVCGGLAEGWRKMIDAALGKVDA